MVKGVFTILVEDGIGEFLWHNENDGELPGVGPNFYILSNEFDDECIMSKKLMHDFCDWVRGYMDEAVKTPWGDTPNIDWEEFNKKGLRLAKSLKDELGEEVKVVYMGAWNAPNRDSCAYTEIK